MTQTHSIPTVTVRQTIHAPAEEVFDAWLDPKLLTEFMRPGNTVRATTVVDPRVGGDFEIVMHVPKGPLPHRGVYRAIERPRRLVFTWNSHATGPDETIVTVEFIAKGDTTELVLTHEKLPSLDAVKGHTEGWTDIVRLMAKGLGAGKPE